MFALLPRTFALINQRGINQPTSEVSFCLYFVASLSFILSISFSLCPYPLVYFPLLAQSLSPPSSLSVFLSLSRMREASALGHASRDGGHHHPGKGAAQLREAPAWPCTPLPLPLTLPALAPPGLSDKAQAQITTMNIQLGDRVVIAGQKVGYQFQSLN